MMTRKEMIKWAKDTVDKIFDSREPRDNWEYIKEFCDKFGIPKDLDELDVLVSYVICKKHKERNGVPSRETILGIWELGNLWKENPKEREGLTQLQYIQKYWFEKCDYLKEHKPEHHWKPSKEQMEALECAERWYSDNMGYDPHLYQLLCDLKNFK